MTMVGRQKKQIHESERHTRGKLRLCQIFRDHGFQAEIERSFPCFVELGGFTISYAVDVYATNGERKIIAEIDGTVGHSSTMHTVARKALRERRIREKYGEDIEIYRFTFDRLTKWTNEEIAQEMRLE